MKFKHKDKLFKNRDWSKPFSKLERLKLFQSYHLFPYELIIELIELEYLHKSPNSLSFYDREKDYGYTEEGTIRFSDHWNYLSKRDNKIHSITDISLKEDQWAKGVYCSLTNSFKIIKIYYPKRTTKVQYRDEIRPMYLELIEQQKLNSKPPQDVIEKRKEFAEKIKNGRVKYNYNGEIVNVIKYGIRRIDLEKSNGEKIILDRGKISTFTKLYPDFAFIVDDIVYTEQMLRDENIMHGGGKHVW